MRLEIIKGVQVVIVIGLHLLRELMAQVDLLDNLEGGKRNIRISDFEQVKRGEKPHEDCCPVDEPNGDPLKVKVLDRSDNLLVELVIKVVN